jgi:small subunit ribosomal protein S11
MAKASGGKRGARRERKNIPMGIVHINATFNNTLITVTDMEGNTVVWTSAGNSNFKGTRKGTPFAAQVAARTAAEKVMEHGMREVDVRVKGPGSGRESSIRAIQATGLKIRSIRDVTPIPHNGCRPPKRRRV